MLFVVDTSTLVNFVNGRVFDFAIRVVGFKFGIGAVVYDECLSIRKELNAAIDAGYLIKFLDDDLDAAAFIDMLITYNLGEGETECLAFATTLKCGVLSDDKKARSVATELFGEHRVSGSLGLLKAAVGQQVITPHEAFAVYERMVGESGFLPRQTIDDFKLL